MLRDIKHLLDQRHFKEGNTSTPEIRDRAPALFQTLAHGYNRVVKSKS